MAVCAFSPRLWLTPLCMFLCALIIGPPALADDLPESDSSEYAEISAEGLTCEIMGESIYHAKQLHGCKLYKKPQSKDPASGLIEFTVTKAGPVYLVCNWYQKELKQGRNAPWANEVSSYKDLVNGASDDPDKWDFLDRCPWRADRWLLYKHCQKGERVRLRTRKSVAPFVLLGPEINPADFRTYDWLAYTASKSIVSTQFQKLYSNSQFEELVEFGKALREHEPYRSGQSAMLPFYEALSDHNTDQSDADWQASLEKIREWQAACPGSSIPQLAEAWVLNDFGWKVRQQDLFKDVTAEEFKLFEQRLQQAIQILDSVESATRDDSAYYILKTKLMRGLNLATTPEEYYELVRSAADRDEITTHLLEWATHSLRGRWIVREPVEETESKNEFAAICEEQFGDAAYGMMIYNDYTPYRFGGFPESDLDYSRLKESLWARMKQHPQHGRWVTLLYLAEVMQDRAYAEEIVREFPDDFETVQQNNTGLPLRALPFYKRTSDGDQAQLLDAYDAVFGAFFSPDDQVVACFGRKAATVFNRETGKHFKRLYFTHRELKAKLVTDSCFLIDDQNLVFGCEDGRLLLWNLKSDEFVEIGKHNNEVLEVRYDTASADLISVCRDGQVKVFQWKKLDEQPKAVPLFQLKMPAKFQGLALSQNLERVVIIDALANVQIWSIPEQSLIGTYQVPVGEHVEDVRIAISADGKRFAVYAAEQSQDQQRSGRANVPGRIVVVETDSLKVVNEFDPTSHGKISQLALSESGEKLAAVGSAVNGRWKMGLVVWNVGDEQPLATMTGHAWPIESVSFSPTSNELVTGARDRTVRIWKLPESEPSGTN